MAVANTLAYYVTATIMTLKSFIVQAPGGDFSRMVNVRLEVDEESYNPFTKCQHMSA